MGKDPPFFHRVYVYSFWGIFFVDGEFLQRLVIDIHRIFLFEFQDFMEKTARLLVGKRIVADVVFDLRERTDSSLVIPVILFVLTIILVAACCRPV